MKEIEVYGKPYNEVASKYGEISKDTTIITDYDDLPIPVKAKIDDHPAVVRAQPRVEEVSKKFRTSERIEFDEERDRDNIEWAKRITNSFEMSKQRDPEHPGKYYREKTRKDLISDRALLREKAYEDAIESKLIDVSDYEMTKSQIQVSDYWALTTTDDEEIYKKYFPNKELILLEDPLLYDDFNYEEHNRRIDKFIERYGKEVTEIIQSQSEEWLLAVDSETGLPIGREELLYRSDRDYIEKSGYFNAQEDAAARLGLSKEWAEYRSLTLDKARERAKYSDIKSIKKLAGHIKLLMRLKDSELEDRIIYWGYSIQPIREKMGPGTLINPPVDIPTFGIQNPISPF